MIRTLTYRSRLDGRDGAEIAEAIRAAVARKVRLENSIRGCRVEVDGDVIDIHLRMSGLDRWRIAGHARKIASYLLASQRLPYVRPLYPVRELDEPSARSLTLEQGRTPQSLKGGRGRRNPDRQAQEWWGDQLPR